MSGKAERVRGAEVRKSRAKSRVQARKHSGDKPGKPRRGPGTSAAPEHGQGAKRDTAAPADRKSYTRLRKAGAARKVEEKPRKVAKAARGKSGIKARGDKRPPEREISPQTHGQDGAASSQRGGKKSGGEAGPVKTAMLGALLIAALAALLWIYTGTGVLNVKHVEIRGNEVLEEGYLRSLSGITGDTHLLKMNVKAVERALMSEPYVAAVDVIRSFPNTVVLEVRERRPSGAIWQNGRYNLVDQEGMILASLETMPAGLVEIRDLQLPLLMPGSELKGVGFARITSLLGSLPRELREKASVVGLRQGDGLYLEASGTLIIYGEASDLSRKNNIALMALISLVERYGAVEYIDVSFPDHPVIKPLGAA